MGEEKAAVIEQILRDQVEEDRQIKHLSTSNDKKETHGWQTVVYPKRHRKNAKPKPEISRTDPRPNGDSNIFRSVELQAEERLRRVLDAQAADAAGDRDPALRSRRHSNDDDDSDEEAAGAVENGVTQVVKKVKQKKPKKPKVTVAEAAAKIDVSDLDAFLADITASYESQQDIQLMRFADYFGRAFASVGAAQFPWLKMFKESTVAKLIDIPISHIPEDVYKTSIDWLNKKSVEALGSFVLWSVDSILADLTSHTGAVKGSKKVVQPTSSKSQVAIFVVLAMVLRRKPDVLISVMPQLKESPKYQGQDKLQVIVWVISQACQGDLAVGLYLWSRLLLPLLSGKTCNPQSRDLILQLVERILSAPKARTILVNGAVRKGERLVPPSALEVLVKVTFPGPSARLKATERYEAIYPTLKEVALAGISGSKAMKQVALQIFSFSIKLAGEGTSDLSNEASSIFIWSLTQNPECYKHWEKIYVDNLEASVLILKKLSNEWKVHSIKHANLAHVNECLKVFKQKNEACLLKEEYSAHRGLLKDADKYCKVIERQVKKTHGCIKFLVLASALAIGAAVISQNADQLELKKYVDQLDLQKYADQLDLQKYADRLDLKKLTQLMDLKKLSELINFPKNF